MYQKQQLHLSRFFILFVAGMAALGPLSIDMYLPTLPDLANSFGATTANANLTVSAFMIGMALGQFLGGPMSDQIGRKPIGLLGLAIIILTSLLITQVNTIEAVLALRVIQGIGGGFASVICLAQVRDVFEPVDVGQKLANIVLVVLIAPMIAPSLGTLVSYFGWRSIFMFLAGFSALMSLIYLLMMPETNRDKTGKLDIAKMLNGYMAAIGNRTNGKLIALRFAMFSGFSAGILFSYVTNAAFILIDHFGMSKLQFSITFGFMGLMLMLGNRISSRLMRQHSAPKILYWVSLAQVLAASVMVAVCLITEPSMWFILAGLSVLIIGNGAISPTAAGYFISLYSRNIGSASSLTSTVMFSFGAIIGGVAAALSHGQLLPIFAVVLASSLIARGFLLSARVH